VTYVTNTVGTITQAALTVTANDDEKVGDALPYSGGNGVSFSGFVGGETSAELGGTLVYGGSAQGAINAGSYVIQASGLTAGNYDISYVNGTLVIRPGTPGAAVEAVLGSTLAQVYQSTIQSITNQTSSSFGGGTGTSSNTGSGSGVASVGAQSNFLPIEVIMAPPSVVNMTSNAGGNFGNISIINGGLNTLRTGSGTQPRTRLEVTPSAPGGINVPLSPTLPVTGGTFGPVQNQDVDQETKEKSKAGGKE
jgi:hypothetical protein